MEKAAVLGKISDLAAPILKSMGLALVDIEYFRGRRDILRIFIDKPGGVTLKDCERASHSISRALDVEDPIMHSYVLEVSSPGLDRPLKRREDYLRSLGKRIRIRMRSEGGHPAAETIIGTIDDLIGDMLVVATEQTRVELPLDAIAHARLEIEF